MTDDKARALIIGIQQEYERRGIAQGIALGVILSIFIGLFLAMLWRG